MKLFNGLLSNLSKKALYETVFLIVADEKLKKKVTGLLERAHVNS
jgi:agmatine deiminase